jgi:hypothetical protein
MAFAGETFTRRDICPEGHLQIKVLMNFTHFRDESVIFLPKLQWVKLAKYV